MGLKSRVGRAMPRSLVASILGLTVILAACGGAGEAADYPNKPVTLVVWASAGSSSDQYGRTLAQALEEHLGQGVVVENRPGGGGLTAMQYILSQPADGYTILGNTASLVTTLNGPDAGDIGLDDFEYLALLQRDPNVLAVPADSPYTTIEEFVAAAKENPGGLNVAGFETGGYHHITMAKLMNAGEFEITWVPYEGAGDAVTAAMGGQVDAVFANPQAMTGGFDSGRIIPIATTAEERLDAFPDVPTFTEAGIDVAEYQWRGLMARAGTPPEAIDTFLAAVEKAIEEPAWTSYMENSQLITSFITKDEYRDFAQTQFDETKEILEQIGVSE